MFMFRYPGVVTNIAQFMTGTFLCIKLDTLQNILKGMYVGLTNLGPILGKNFFKHE